jgi:hypothetical protein
VIFEIKPPAQLLALFIEKACRHDPDTIESDGNGFLPYRLRKPHIIIILPYRPAKKPDGGNHPA